jgi:DNA-binding CsgD family transcriptional regulator/tetratricopeptide (TPR) repeat protein
MGSQLLEREHELHMLVAAAEDAAARSGSVALVYGEPGIGKSSLVEALREQLPGGARLLVGYCDDLATKRTFGPFHDLVSSVGDQLTRALQDGGDRDRVLPALRAELDGAGHATVLAVEDVHWADEATLDALRYLVRRIVGLPAVVLLTYRDDELAGDHPLRQLLGLAAGIPRLHRLPLRSLSEHAVRQLSAGMPIDAGHVYSITAGNPYFVAEVLESGDGDHVPPTIVDAVQSRLRRLDASAQQALAQLAVVPTGLEHWLVEALVPGGVAPLAAAEQRGLLTVSPERVAFRHELTRRAIADAMPGARRVELNRRVLAALVARDGADLSQIMHHAAEAGDVDAIVRYGPEAAREAARGGAHREAAAHYRQAVAQRGRFGPAERAELLERYAVECYHVRHAEQALDAQRAAVALRRDLGGEPQLGAALRWLSRMHWWNGDPTGAGHAADEAVEVLERAGDTRLFALALSNRSQLHMLANRSAESIAIGQRAATLARRVGDPDILTHALTNVGLSQWSRGDPDAPATMEEALRVALAAGATEHALRAYVGIASALLDNFQLADAGRYLAKGIDLAEESEHLGFHTFLTLERARLTLAHGAWNDAVGEVEFAQDDAQPPVRWAALATLGRVRVRLGRPGAEETLGRAWRLATRMRELQRTAPVAAGLAEAAWLREDPASVRAIAEPVYHEARRLGAVAHEAELAWWLAAAGSAVPEVTADHPYAMLAAGRWRDAARLWRTAGCPYEHALAMAQSPDPDDLLTALAMSDSMGAEPLARQLRRRLRARGITRLPRGPARTTRANPAELTSRQLEVCRLLGESLTNAEIAERLVVSVRTVDGHVAAVLDKLGARTRRQAAARAAELGILNKAHSP